MPCGKKGLVRLSVFFRSSKPKMSVPEQLSDVNMYKVKVCRTHGMATCIRTLFLGFAETLSAPPQTSCSCRRTCQEACRVRLNRLKKKKANYKLFLKPARPDKSVISPLRPLNPPVTAAPQTQVSSSQEGKIANLFLMIRVGKANLQRFLPAK